MGASSKKNSEISRAERKTKKRKLEDAIPDLPGDDNDNDAEAVVDDAAGEKKSKKRKTASEEEMISKEPKSEKKGKKERKERKAKSEAVAENGEANGVEDTLEEGKASKKEKKKKKKSNIEEEESKVESPDAETAVNGDENAVGETPVEEGPKKSKKERKAERKAKEAAEKAASKPDEEEGDAKINPAGTTSEEGKAKKNNRNREKNRKAAVERETTKAPRFIVFVGNLPFSATTESVTKHFASVKPISVRHLTQKENAAKSKGCAFVEFDGYDHMKTCLKLFHHSSFDDGISPARKINVELTAGGGGNTQDRKTKIQDKNQKLNEQRFRRIQEEVKVKGEKRKEAAVDESGIHPSRRTRVPLA